MSAASKAQKLKEEEAKRKSEEAARDKEVSRHREREKRAMAGWIKSALDSFGLQVKKEWFAGNDYWCLMDKNGTCLCSCVLSFERHSVRYSDDTDPVDRAGWEIAVCRGEWSGPNCRSIVMAGITDQGSLENYVAHVMKDY